MLTTASEFRRWVSVKKEVMGGWGEEGKGNGEGCSQEGEFMCWVLCFEAFISFLQMRILGEVSRERFSRIFISSQGLPFQGHDLHWLVTDKAGDLQSFQLVLASPTWFCCFSGPGAETQQRPRCYLQGGKAREEVGGGESQILVFPVFPPARHWGLLSWWPLAPGCKWLSHCVQLSVSVSLFHLSKNFPSFLLGTACVSSLRLGPWFPLNISNTV